MNFKFDNVYLYESSVIVGKLEKEGPLSKYFDDVFKIDYHNFEKSEIELLNKSIRFLFDKTNYSSKDIDLMIGGDLSNQLAISSYFASNLDISNIGIYGACSNICLGIGIAGICLINRQINNVMVYTSSMNQTAEKQFRNPIEYGGYKINTQTFTSTVGGSCIISTNKSNVKVKSFTVGKVIDIGFMDCNDYGRAMAPAAIETLLNHFKLTNTKPVDYDLILTGDLSIYGSKLVLKALTEEYGIIDNYNDCGNMLFNIHKQPVFAGGSGPGTVAAVMLGYVYQKIKEGLLNKVLICGTGVLFNTTMVNQKNSLPCIAHIIELERSI